MNGRILVVYASRTGSTREVAETIAGVLREQNLETEVHSVQEVKELSPYFAVVLGSAARWSRLYAEAVSFVKKHRSALQKMPVAVFLSCTTMNESTEKNRETALGYLQPITSQISALSVGLFAGKFDPAAFGGLMGKMMKNVKAEDHRDWEAIRSWASSLPAAFGLSFKG
jgi:menaquinone-dependent protoporphyrinogen oxidase